MNTLHTGLIVALLAFIGLAWGPCRAQEDRIKWKPFISPEGDFSVLVPAELQKAKRTAEEQAQDIKDGTRLFSGGGCVISLEPMLFPVPLEKAVKQEEEGLRTSPKMTFGKGQNTKGDGWTGQIVDTQMNDNPAQLLVAIDNSNSEAMCILYVGDGDAIKSAMKKSTNSLKFNTDKAKATNSAHYKALSEKWFKPKTPGETVGCISIWSGILLAAIGWLWYLGIAFRQNVLWGFATLLLPLAWLVFMSMHFFKVWKPFLVQTIGVVLCIAGCVMGPK